MINVQVKGLDCSIWCQFRWPFWYHYVSSWVWVQHWVKASWSGMYTLQYMKHKNSSNERKVENRIALLWNDWHKNDVKTHHHHRRNIALSSLHRYKEYMQTNISLLPSPDLQSMYFAGVQWIQWIFMFDFTTLQIVIAYWTLPQMIIIKLEMCDIHFMHIQNSPARCYCNNKH